MWDSLLRAFGALLAFFYGLIPNYGIAIVLVTVSIRLLLYPLTAKQARSMAAMQRLQPDIKKIQTKHKNDRQKLNEELMAFYKEHQINPLAGCLPLLLQFPVFIALFRVLRGPAKFISEGTDLFRAFCPGVKEAAQCVQPKGLSFLSMDLSRGANADHGSFVTALPFFLLIGLVIASGYLQSRQMMSLQKGRATAQSQIMTRVFPVFFGLISYTLPAGVVLYFFVSNLWQIGQQAVIFGRGDVGTPSKGGAAKGRGGVKPGAQTAVVEATARDADPGREDIGEDTGEDALEVVDPPKKPTPTPLPKPKASAKAPPTAKAGAPAHRPDRSKNKKRRKRKRKR